jgi:uncharacterized protein
MSSTHYQVLQGLIKSTQSLRNLLLEVQKQASDKEITQESILQTRLAPDMFPFVKQVQLVSDGLKGYARLTNKEIPSMPDNEDSIDALVKRLDNTLDFATSIEESDFANADDAKIILPWMERMMPNKFIPGSEYILEMAIPNFYFHYTIAYAILRHLGFNIGKVNFLGNVTMKDLESN